MAKKAYVGVENFTPRELPSGYTQVEYIESSGTQYIDTRIAAKSTLKVQIKFCLSEVQGYAIVGYYNSEDDAFRLFNYSEQAYLDFGNATKDDGRIYGGSLATGKTYDVEFGNHYVKNLETDENIISGTEVSSFTRTTNIYLCGNTNYAKGKFYYLKIYDGSTIVRDFIPCKNSSGTVGMYDFVTGTFYTNDGTGVFADGPGRKGIARKVKKQYIGVDGVARKIKRAYVGVGGIARMWWNGGGLSYYGTTTGLSVARRQPAATTVGNYALFGGGNISGSDVVDAYDTSLTRTTPTALSVARTSLAASTVGGYALFGGGFPRFGYSNVVDAYDTSLTRTTPTALSAARYRLASTTVGNYALFGGGYGQYSSYNLRVDAYDKSLTRTTATNLSLARDTLSATTVGKYALFGGGGYNDSSSTRYDRVDSYDTSLTRTTPTALSVARHSLAATTVGDYALFGGGYASYSLAQTTVDAYDTSLTRTTPTSLRVGRHQLAATTVGDYALFGGGHNGSAHDAEIVDSYDKSLTRNTATNISVARYQLAATTVGDYALFGGGAGSDTSLEGATTISGDTATVDVYTA